MKLSWLRIPQAMRMRAQWAVASMAILPNGKPDKSPRHPISGARLDVTKPLEWATFDQCASAGYPAIGFLLTPNDPFVVIDLDDPESLDAQSKARQQKVYEAFDSYAERSISGKGVHIVLEGKIGGGYRRDGIELYDQERFIICTGDVLRDAPVGTNPMLETLAAEMGMRSSGVADLPEDQPVTTSDEEILAKMLAARNAEKFKDLFYRRPAPGEDWSQRDASLAQMIAFWTRNHEQALRLFRQSALYRGDGQKYGSVEKYERDYLLARTFGRAWRAELVRDADLKHGENLAKALLTGAPGSLKPSDTLPPISFPPGLVGEVADFIYRAAQRPVPEIALAGAITLCAGIFGRCYNTATGTGLNVFAVIVAETGRGKEGASSGVNKLLSHLSVASPGAAMTINSFRGPAHIASGQALIRSLSENPCQFSFLSEFGHTLKIITDPRASAADIMTRKVLLDLFMKSGKGEVVLSSIYSDKDKNTKPIEAPAFSFLGDTTPGTFYDTVSSTLVEDGFLPRLLTIVYDGPRVPQNETPVYQPSDGLIQRLSAAALSVANMTKSGHVEMVKCCPQAWSMLQEFNKLSDWMMNKDEHGHVRAGRFANMWNRAHLKALRLASLVAVGRSDNHAPVVSVEDAQWAINLVKRELAQFNLKDKDGELDDGEDAQLSAIINATIDCLSKNPTQRASYNVPAPARDKPIVPYVFYRRKVQNLTAFKKDRRGNVTAIKAALQDAVDTHVLQKLSDAQVDLMLGPGHRSMDYYAPGPAFPGGDIR